MYSTSEEELCRKLQQTVRHLQILAKSKGAEADGHSKVVQEKTLANDDLQTQVQESIDRVLELEHQLDISYQEIESLRQEAEDEQQGQIQTNLEELQNYQVHLLKLHLASITWATVTRHWYHITRTSGLLFQLPHGIPKTSAEDQASDEIVSLSLNWSKSLEGSNR